MRRCRAPVEGTLARVELPEGTTFVLDDESQLDGVLAWLLESGARVRAVTPQRASLEDFFLTVAESRPGVEPRRRSA